MFAFRFDLSHSRGAWPLSFKNLAFPTSLLNVYVFKVSQVLQNMAWPVMSTPIICSLKISCYFLSPSQLWKATPRLWEQKGYQLSGSGALWNDCGEYFWLWELVKLSKLVFARNSIRYDRYLIKINKNQ